MVDNSERSIALVVEDDPWIRLLLRDLLTDEGYAVLEASNGSAALRLAERQPPALVPLDLVLPEQPGLARLTVRKSLRITVNSYSRNGGKRTGSSAQSVREFR